MFGRQLAVALVVVSSWVAAAQDKPEVGHSHLGSAFDSGLRSKPWKFKGLGSAPFPISTKVKEMQSWYNQGNELLHSFWFEEAERTFRWCLKLDRENAMVYFGLARCGLNWFTIGSSPGEGNKRFYDFLKEAVKRKSTVSNRESLYIEAWDAAFALKDEEARKEMVRQLQKLCILYPDDLEAKTQLAFYNIGQGSTLANEFLIQQVLKVNPMHPGAHHARIHNWDGQDGGVALASCELYGKAAPGVGHALHMPGHIYSGIGMWHEAAIAMDSATRVELRHMNERLALPFENWNYAHNRDYLCYIQEQLGHAQASIQGSLDILNSPRDPAYKEAVYQGLMALARAYTKFEMWDRILDEKSLPTPEDKDVAEMVAMVRAVAYAETGQPAKGRELQKSVKAPPGMGLFPAPAIFDILEAKLLLAEGKHEEGLGILLKAATNERKQRAKGEYPNDPPFEAWPTMRLVGDAYLAAKDPAKAISAYTESLSQVPNDAWSLAGLAKAYVAQGKPAMAMPFAERFMAVWSGADPNLKLMNEVLALNLNAKPRAETFRPERVYRPADLAKWGPSNWQPFDAPELDCLDMNGKRVRLTDFRGKNVLLVFYLSDQCIHCVEQLGAIDKRNKDFQDLNTVVLAVSATSPEANKDSVKLSPFNAKLLSDTNHVNARRFASYDDFEDIELHSTTLIDAQGRVRWKRSGGDPFSDVDFLLGEIRRWPR
ncbi:MAG: redoxin domain-containing protein [Chthonomonas sp.]|nr:redoxin domain-containing protein [Chthonomonas sp.]